MDKSDGPCAGITSPAMVRISNIASYGLPQSRLLEGKSDGAIKSETILFWFVLRQIKSHNLSVADLNEVLKIDNKFALAYYNLGVIKGKLKDYTGANDEYTKSIELDPQYKNAYFNRGLTKNKQFQDYLGAIADFTNYLRIDPQDDEAYYHRGVAKGNLEDMKGACLDWKKSASLGNKTAREFIKNDC